MKIEIDTHSHTLVSGHAYNTLREMAHMAAEKGLKGLAVTEHAPEMPGSTGLYYFQNLGWFRERCTGSGSFWAWSLISWMRKVL